MPDDLAPLRPVTAASSNVAGLRWPAICLILAMTYYTAGVLALATARQGEVEPVLFARLLATGHMGQFVRMVRDRTPPADTWARASEWQRFERLEDHGVWRRIAADSGQYEAHPPFFFWLMHAALLLGVSDHWHTTVINLPAALATGLLIVAMTAYLTRNRWCAALAGVCWFVSPLVMTNGDAVRSPTVFALVTLLLLWLSIDWARRPHAGTAWRAVATTVMAVLGMLNHFEMAIALAACGLFLFWRNRRACWVYTTAVVVAAGLFLLIDPHALHSLAFNRSVNDYEPVTPRNVVIRVLKEAVGLSHFLAMDPKWARAMVLLVPLTLAAGWLTRRFNLAATDDAIARPSALSDTARLTLVVLGLDTFMYLTWRLPQHAYGANYFPGLIVLTPVWLGIAIVCCVRPAAVRAAVVAVLLVSSACSAGHWFGLYADARATNHTLAQSDLLLSDAVRIHGIPRYSAPLNPNSWVLAARRDRLAEQLRSALDNHKRVAVLVDCDQSQAADDLSVVLDRAVRAGVLQRDRGLEYFAPDFDLYATPTR